MVFRALGNPNRLHILQLLQKNKSMSVTELAESLNISFKNTSRNLSILQNLGLVESEGKMNHIFYSLGKNIKKEETAILRLSVWPQ